MERGIFRYLAINIGKLPVTDFTLGLDDLHCYESLDVLAFPSTSKNFLKLWNPVSGNVSWINIFFIINYYIMVPGSSAII